MTCNTPATLNLELFLELLYRMVQVVTFSSGSRGEVDP